MIYHSGKEPSQSKIKAILLRGLLYLGILLILLLPTYAAIAAYTLQRNTPLVSVLTVYDEMQLNGPKNGTAHASKNENTTLFADFTALCESGNEVIAIPETHRAGHYTATMLAKDVADRYDFYFLPGHDTCYYISPGGKIFRSYDARVTEFLNSPYAFELYEAATLPVLTTAATDEVLPTTVNWQYRTANGQFTQHTAAATTQQLHTYPIANDIAFYFSIQPSSYEIVIYREGEDPYRVTSDAISLPLKDNEVLDIEIRATFDADSRLDYYGELFYRFRMQVVEAAHFSLNTSTPTTGDILLLTCENVKNEAKLQITAQPALSGTPILFRRGDYVYAALPVCAAGDYTLRVTYGTVSGTFDLHVTPADGTAVDTADLNGDWIALLNSKLPTLIQANGATADSGLTPNGTLAQPKGEKLLGFGDRLEVADTAFTVPSLSFDLYRTSDALTALAAGRVLVISSDLHLGKYVIIDHGCGLYTWYAGLSEVRVSAGDILAIGDVVGLPSTALHHEKSALLMATLGKAAVSLDPLCTACPE